MKFLEDVMEKWETFCENAQPVWEKIVHVFREIGKAFGFVFGYLFKMRKIFLAIPVVIGAIYLALYNLANLPAIVGFDLMATGEFGTQLPREVVVFGCLLVTLVCLLLMLCSKRVLTPWMVSMISLILPVVILLANTFPS